MPKPDFATFFFDAGQPELIEHSSFEPSPETSIETAHIGLSLCLGACHVQGGQIPINVTQCSLGALGFAFRSFLAPCKRTYINDDGCFFSV